MMGLSEQEKANRRRAIAERIYGHLLRETHDAPLDENEFRQTSIACISYFINGVQCSLSAEAAREEMKAAALTMRPSAG
jgi:hypothetical protein